MSDVNLGQAVDAAIRAAGTTQMAVADATGIDQGRISKMIRGAEGRRPTLDELRKIEEACGWPYGYILGFAGLVTPDGVQRGAEAAARLSPKRKPK